MSINLSQFRGIKYRLCNNWLPILPVERYASSPIKYLEIGTLCGANLLSVAQTFGRHPESELHCIDPWEDYEEYDEYKARQETHYDLFRSNVATTDEQTQRKIKVHRGYSHLEVPKLEDNTFDIIYIDGNHLPEYVLEDAVLCFRKLKPEGIMIFDDYGWGGPDLTKRGIDGFLNGYHKRIAVIGHKETQVFVRKLK